MTALNTPRPPAPARPLPIDDDLLDRMIELSMRAFRGTISVEGAHMLMNSLPPLLEELRESRRTIRQLLEGLTGSPAAADALTDNVVQLPNRKGDDE